MSTTELKEWLIEKIRDTEKELVPEEVSRLLEIESEAPDTYILSNGQKKAIDEARAKIRLGKFLTDAAANKEIDNQ